MIAAYHKLLTGDDVQVQLAAAKARTLWEGKPPHCYRMQSTLANLLMTISPSPLPAGKSLFLSPVLAGGRSVAA